MLKRLVDRQLAELHKLIQARRREQAGKAIVPLKKTAAQFYKHESTDERELRERDERYRQRHEQVHGLAQDGQSGREIARLTGLSRNTVKRILDEPEYCGVPQRRSHPSPIDTYKDYIAARMEQGCINALQLFKEVTAQGFKGGYATVWRVVRRSALQFGSVNTPHVPVRLRQSPAEVPTVFEIIQWLMGKKHALTTDQTTLLQDWVDSSSAVKAGRDAAIQFAEILTKRQPDRLDEWIAKAAASSVTPLKQFAKGIQADHDAVIAALQMPWSNEHMAYCTS